MLDFAKIHLIVPFKYHPESFVKLEKMSFIEGKETAEELDTIKRNQSFDQKIWFNYCFSSRPVPQSSQLEGSPIIDKASYSYIKRVELSQVQRKAIGLHHNESKQYILKKENIGFQIGKIRLMFSSFGIGFIVFEVSAQNLTAEQLLDLNASLYSISRGSKFIYEQSIDKSQTKKIEVSLKEVVKKTLDLQTYVPLRPYSDLGIRQCYSLIYCTGEVLGDDKERFLESLRRGFKSGRDVTLDKNSIFNPFSYIAWAVGEEILACFGDTAVCGEANKRFVADSKNGLCQSVSDNYLIIYSYLIAIYLLVNDIDKMGITNTKYETETLIYRLVTDRLSSQEHISKLFKVYLCEQTWNLEQRIRDIKIKYQQFNQTRSSIESGQRLENIDVVIKDLQEKTDEILNNTRYLTNFANHELKDFLAKERAKLNAAKINEEGKDIAIGQFIQQSSVYIERKVNTAMDKMHNEEVRLSILLGSAWAAMMPTTRTSLISAGVLWESCLDLEDAENFDYSGICICTTAALEAELRRVFFDGLIQYMVHQYGIPCNANADYIFDNWPEQLLSISKYKFDRSAYPQLNPQKNFTMGNLPFLLGEFENTYRNNYQQIAQSKLMAKRMEEYLATILKKQYVDEPLTAFTKASDNGPAFVKKCEGVRNNYRNPAAHVDVMSRDQAEGCLQQVIGKAEAYEHNARVTGVLMELFSRIDADKLIR